MSCSLDSVPFCILDQQTLYATWGGRRSRGPGFSNWERLASRGLCLDDTCLTLTSLLLESHGPGKQSQDLAYMGACQTLWMLVWTKKTPYSPPELLIDIRISPGAQAFDT